MEETWRTVRVFISSTFRDMHAERDHLVRVVFPELKERCRKRHVNLIDVDLRWGVTEKQAEGGGALDICLDEIDTCRPYFLGLLGQRYGSIPAGNEHSITAEEIFHGVLHNDLPRQVMDLRPFVEGILEGKTLLKEQVNCLVRNYRWDGNKRKYLIKQNVTPEDESTLRSIFKFYSIYQKDRSFFFFRAESLTRKLAGNNIHDYFENDDTLKGKLETLKQEIKDKLTWSTYDDIETFGQNVLETLWKRIDAEFPEGRKDEQRDWLKEEAELHELFIADRTRRFVGRLGFLKKMHDFVENDNAPRLMVVTGESGRGKSALMARFTEEVIHHHPDWLILSHFVGASPSSTNLRLTLRRLCTQIYRSCDFETEKQKRLSAFTGENEQAKIQRETVEKEFLVPEEYQQLISTFQDFLKKAANARKVLISIDALNQLERTESAHTMGWLPQKLPPDVKVVVSTLAGEILDALKTWRIQPRFEELIGLNKEEIKDFVTTYLEEIDKKFPNSQIEEAFYNKIKEGNPLYISVALEELRIFPVFEEISKRVDRLPDSVSELFDQVLERVEGDFNRPLVQDFMSFIACGRQGMTGEELQTLLKGHAPILDPVNTPEKFPDMLFARLRRAFSGYLFERSGVIDFFHTQLKEAVGKRYLPEETDRDKVHQTIANYFETRWSEPYLRALDELPNQMTKAKNWKGLERVLCDLRFIEAKCAAGMTYDLIHDYNNTLDALPEAQPEKLERLKHEARLKKYTEDLIAYAKGEIEFLDIIPSVEPWSDKKIRQDIERITNNPTRQDKIQAFSQFVNSESDALVKFGSYPGFCIQQAFNSSSSGQVAGAAEIIIKADPNSVLLLRNPFQRVEYEPRPTLLRTIHQNNQADSLSITPDGKTVVSGDKMILKVWDANSGQCLNTLEGHTGWIESTGITPDGRKAVSASGDKTIKVWDLESEQCIITLHGHEDVIRAVAITPDGSRVVSGGETTLRVWDTITGRCFRKLEWNKGTIMSVEMTPDGRKVVFGGLDGTLYVLDVESGRYLSYFQGYKSAIMSISITPDGSTTVSSNFDGALDVWDLRRGQHMITIQAHALQSWAVSITPDGKMAVSGGRDEAVRVWDLDTGQCLRELIVHGVHIHSIDITADGKRVVSGGYNTLKIWEVNNGRFRKIPKKRIDNELTVMMTQDRKRAFSVVSDGILKVWNVNSGKFLRTIENHNCHIEDALCTPDEKRYIIRDNHAFKEWDIESRHCTRTFSGHGGRIHSVSLTTDGRRAVSRSYDGTIRAWDMANGQSLNMIRMGTHKLSNVNLTPDTKLVIFGRFDNTLKIWDWNSGKYLKNLLGHTDEITDVRVTTDGRRAISCSRDRTIRVWDIGKGQCIRTIQGHTDGVYSINITVDGNMIFSKSSDFTTRLWELDKGQSVAVYHSFDRHASLSHLALRRKFTFGTTSGMIFLNAANLPAGIPNVTSVRLWLSEHKSDWLFGRKIDEGQWDNQFTSMCLWCHRRFPVNTKILDAIRVINRNANVSPDQSPCLELPDEAWKEPKLLSECPLCHKPLKFNPFIVDNKGRY